MKHSAQIIWQRNGESFNPKSYDRTHQLKFPGGHVMEASAAPQYAGNAQLPNPEELLAASLSSCFMLTFLYLAAMKGIVIDEYTAVAEGTLAKNEEGKMAMTEVVIKPRIKFQDDKLPEQQVLDDLFKKSHDQCFISNSVKTKVLIAADNPVSAG